MKKITTILFILMFGGFLMAGSAMGLAVSFNYGGGFELTDTNSDGFAETLDLNSSVVRNYITSVDPGFDSILNNDASLGISSFVTFGEKDDVIPLKFTLDSTNYVLGDRYYFSPDEYVDAFNVYDKDGDHLLQADLMFDPLVIVSNTTGVINGGFSINLSNVEIFYLGSSVILDLFASADQGNVNFTFNGDALVSMIGDVGSTSTAGGDGSYSSTAAVPEPATMLLFGVGLVGLGAYGRKRFSKRG